MILQVATSITDQEAQVQIATITGVFAFLGILVTAIAARVFSHPRTPKVDPDATRNKMDSVLATYTGDQNEFIRLVIHDSKDIHERLAQLDEVVDRMKKERHQFLGAVGRYISKLSQVWGSTNELKMPYPDDADFTLLEETLPANWRRNSTNKGL